MAKLRQKSGIYFVDYRVDGKRMRKNVGKNKKLAELALKDLEVKLERKELGFEKKDGKFSRLLTEFKAYCETNVAASTAKRYRAILDNFCRFKNEKYLHIDKLTQFNAKHFEEFKAFRKIEGAQHRTINSELIVIRMMFRLGVQWGYLPKNPTDGVSKLKLVKKVAPDFLTKQQCKDLLDACDEFMFPIIFTFLYTGMRKAELENLEWRDVNFNRRKIQIVVKDDWSPKTNEREIPINDDLDVLLKKQKKKYGDSRYVFPDENGEKIFRNRLRRRFMALTKQCGFPEITKIHTLRHTFASHLVMGGVDLATVKRLLGHSDIQTTMIYSHLADEHVDRAMDKVSF